MEIIDQKTIVAAPSRLKEVKLKVVVDEENSTSLAEKVAILIKQLNIRLPGGCRLARYMSIFEDPTSSVQDKIVARIELSSFVIALSHIGNPSQWKETIDAAISGSIHPIKEKSNTKERDYGFELYCAGRLNAAGVWTRRGEPDLICTHNNFVFTVAAKRVKSKKKIVKRFREARNQIEASGINGVVAFDLSPLEDYYYTDFPTESVEQFRQRNDNYRDTYIEECIDEIKKREKVGKVIGVIAFANLGGISSDGQSIWTCFNHNGYCFRPRMSDDAQNMWRVVNSLGNGVDVYK